MNQTKIIKSILDANVLYPAPLRDLLLNIAELELYEPKWSDKIQNEWTENLLKNRKDLKSSQLNRTVKLMNEAFQKANVKGFASIQSKLKLPDPNDCHVLAAAIKSKSSIIITNNLKDFPRATLKKYKIKAISPDKFIVRLLKEDKESIEQALLNQLKSLKNPPLSKSELLELLKINGLVQSVKLLEK